MIRSAGILLFKTTNDGVEVLIGHPGSPLWAKKDFGYWSVPKGKLDGDESAKEAAKREFTEETGLPLPNGELISLGEIEQYGKKTVSVWAAESNIDTSSAKSNTFQLEWPPHSGKIQEYPELDRIEWFNLEDAAKRLNRYQGPLLERLAEYLGVEFKLPAEPEQSQLKLN